MSVLFPGDRCVVNIAGSVQRALGLPARHPSIPEIDGLGLDTYENVILLIVDGMGMAILEENLEAGGFFRSHLLTEGTSCFPSTTVAATTSYRTGLYPIEHGWLGWSMWFPEMEENVVLFKDTYAHGEEPIGLKNYAFSRMPYEPITEQVARVGRKGYVVGNFAPPYPQTIEEVCDLTRAALKEPGRKYLYVYSGEPDHGMHLTGIHSRESVEMLQRIEKNIEELCRGLTNTIVLIAADHGHIDVDQVYLGDYPQIVSLFREHPKGEGAKTFLRNDQGIPVIDPSIDPRAMTFFVKEGKEREFVERFTDAFGEDFLLFTREEALKRELFGPVSGMREKVVDSIGDFVAAGTGKKALFVTQREAEKYIGHHTGLTEEEMRIPILCV